MLSKNEMEEVLDVAGKITINFVTGMRIVFWTFITLLLLLMSSVGYIIYDYFWR